MNVWVHRVGAQTLEIEVDLYDDRHGTDGVPFRLVVSDGMSTLLEITRAPINGEPWYPNGRECDEPEGYWCRRAQFEVWPASISGLTCTGLPLGSKVDVDFPRSFSPSELAGSSVALCHGTRCGNVLLDSFPCYPGGAWFDGELGGGIDWDCEDGVVTAKATAVDDPALLADGDTWRLSAWKSGTQIFDVRKTVTYEESYPNGPQCDAYPKRTAR